MDTFNKNYIKTVKKALNVQKNSNILQAFKFLCFSVSAGVIQILSFTLLNEFCSVTYYVAYLIALVLSVLWNFTFNRKYTFKSSKNVPIAMLLVFAYYCVFTPLSTLFEKFLGQNGVNEYIATAINMIINFVTEFLWQKFVVFREKPSIGLKK